MVESRYKFCTAYGTGLCCCTGSCLTLGVTKCLDCCLALDVIATRTILICCVAGLGAGCILAVNVNEGVVESRYKFCTAYGTGLCGSTGFCCTGGVRNNCSNEIVGSFFTIPGNLACICCEVLITNSTMLIFIITCSGTRSSICSYGLKYMTSCRKCITYKAITATVTLVLCISTVST